MRFAPKKPLAPFPPPGCNPGNLLPGDGRGEAKAQQIHQSPRRPTRAKRLECVQLAGAFRRGGACDSGSKLRALQTLRAQRMVPIRHPAPGEMTVVFGCGECPRTPPAGVLTRQELMSNQVGRLIPPHPSPLPKERENHRPRCNKARRAGVSSDGRPGTLSLGRGLG